VSGVCKRVIAIERERYSVHKREGGGKGGREGGKEGVRERVR